MTPDEIMTWVGAIAAGITTITVAVRKAAPAWREVVKHLGVGEDESLREIVVEARDAAKQAAGLAEDNRAEIVVLKQRFAHLECQTPIPTPRAVDDVRS